MKKKPYIAPSTTQVLMEIAVQILAESNENGAYGGESDAKESNAEFEEESLINPTQPNLWDDNEEE
jgi:hypothetical protein